MTETTADLSTELLRTSNDQPYRRLREVLEGQGVNPQADILADLFPDDVDQEFGVVVTTARRVFTFVLCYSRRGDLKAQAANATIGDWTEITERWKTSPYREAVSQAFRMLDPSSSGQT